VRAGWIFGLAQRISLVRVEGCREARREAELGGEGKFGEVRLPGVEIVY